MGYVLKPGFMLPPLMFSTEEIEALVLGTRWVAQRSDARLGLAARNALAKIGAVLPPEVRDELDAIPLLIGPSAVCVVDRVDLSQIRQAIRAEQKVDITYRDDKGADSVRTIWPFALGFDSVRIVMRLVRAAPGLPPISAPPPHRRAERRSALPAPAPRAAQGMARAQSGSGTARGRGIAAAEDCCQN